MSERIRPVLKWIVLLVFPLLITSVLLGSLELVLRNADYGKRQEPFFGPGVLHPNKLRGVADEYYMVSPFITTRYPRNTSLTKTSRPSNFFRRQKPTNGFRVVVLGGSSAAGFPFFYSYRFSEILRNILQDTLPNSRVEVVNFAAGSLNTYSVYDVSRWASEINPDAVLIYSGHNEYYGRLGVTANLGSGISPRLVRLHLRLLDFKVYQLARDTALFLSNKTTSYANDLLGALAGSDRGRSKERRTAQRHRGKPVPKGTERYREGLHQLRSNLEASLDIFRARNIPVFVSGVVSNVRNQPPLLPTDQPGEDSSLEIYNRAREMLEKKNIKEARELFVQARNLDPGRVRASSDINDIIRTVSRRENSHYVPVPKVFKNHSKHGIPGKELFVDHLHPNRKGQMLIARTFYRSLLKSGILDETVNRSERKSWDHYRKNAYLSDLVERRGLHNTWAMGQHWPFDPDRDEWVPENYPEGYQPASRPDELAMRVVFNNFSMAKAHEKLANHYIQRDAHERALKLFEGLRGQEFWRDLWYQRPAQLLWQKGTLPRAAGLAERIFQLNPTANNSLLLGGILTDQGELQRAKDVLTDARERYPDNPKILYFLSKIHIKKKEYGKALSLVERLVKEDADIPGLEKLRSRLRQLTDRP